MHIACLVETPFDAQFYRGIRDELRARGQDVTVFSTGERSVEATLERAGVQFLSCLPTDDGRGQAGLGEQLLDRVRTGSFDVLAGSGIGLGRIGRVGTVRSVAFVHRERHVSRPLLRCGADEIHTPVTYPRTLGPAHVRYHGYPELATVVRDDKTDGPCRDTTPYFVLGPTRERLGLSGDLRAELATRLGEYGPVWTLERDGGPVRRRYEGGRRERIDSVGELQAFLAGAALYVGTSYPTTVWSALRGTPTLAPAVEGSSPVLAALEEYGLLEHREAVELPSRVRELVPNPAATGVWRERLERFRTDHCDVTRYAAGALTGQGTGCSAETTTAD